MKIDLKSGIMEETVDIPDENILGILEPSPPSFDVKDKKALIWEAIDTPIASPCLDRLIHPHTRIAIVVDDHTRPTPTKEILDVVLRKLADLQVKDERISITVASGLHRQPTSGELLDIFGGEILEKHDVTIHDARDTAVLTFLGTTQAGTPLWVNTRVAEADLVITLGMIKSHSFAGLTGGAKSILPGVSGQETILTNHRYECIEYPNGITGEAELSVPRKDMEEAALKLPVFMVNVVLDLEQRVVGAFAGNVVEAHRKGGQFFRQLAAIQVNEQADVVIVEGSYPASESLYFSFSVLASVLTTKSPIVKKGGTVIILTQCREGIGAKILEEMFTAFDSPEAILTHLEHSPTAEGQWAVQHLASYLLHCDVAIVTSGLKKEDIERLKMRSFPAVQAALQNAFEKYGKGMKILLVKKADFLIANVCSSE